MDRREALTAMLTLPFAAVLPKPQAVQTISLTLDGKVLAERVIDDVNVTVFGTTTKVYRPDGHS